MIKPIDEIPVSIPDQRHNYRDMIRNDILEAMEKGILKFEFTGDYKYKYLPQYAREVAEGIVRKMFRDWCMKHQEYKQKDGWYSVDCWKLNRDKEIIKVSSIKGDTPDNRRVFCVIAPDIEKRMADFVEKQIEDHENWEQKRKERKREVTKSK